MHTNLQNLFTNTQTCKPTHTHTHTHTHTLETQRETKTHNTETQTNSYTYRDLLSFKRSINAGNQILKVLDSGSHFAEVTTTGIAPNIFTMFWGLHPLLVLGLRK